MIWVLILLTVNVGSQSTPNFHFERFKTYENCVKAGVAIQLMDRYGALLSWKCEPMKGERL